MGAEAALLAALVAAVVHSSEQHRLRKDGRWLLLAAATRQSASQPLTPPSPVTLAREREKGANMREERKGGK